MSIIRIAEERDFKGINSVIAANKSKKDDVYKFPYYFNDFGEILPTKNQIIFVVEKGQNIIAFLSLHNNDLFRHGSMAEFEMVVHPAYRDRKKHYGETLLKHVINYTETKTKVILLDAKVLKKNVPSIKLLQKCGFSSDSDDRGDADGFHMKLKINR